MKKKYIDGYVLVIPEKNVAAYRKMAQKGMRLWMKHGALGYKECMGNDLHPDTGGYPIRYFPKMTQAKKGETVWFSYIEYKSKKHRDQVNKRVMKDPSMQSGSSNMKMPFDMKRMAFGGFTVVVSD